MALPSLESSAFLRVKENMVDEVDVMICEFLQTCAYLCCDQSPPPKEHEPLPVLGMAGQTVVPRVPRRDADPSQRKLCSWYLPAQVVVHSRAALVSRSRAMEGFPEAGVFARRGAGRLTQRAGPTFSGRFRLRGRKLGAGAESGVHRRAPTSDRPPPTHSFSSTTASLSAHRYLGGNHDAPDRLAPQCGTKECNCMPHLRMLMTRIATCLPGAPARRERRRLHGTGPAHACS